MSGKFELKKARNGQFHWVLKASNGQVILSSEMYKTKASATNGIKSVKTNAKKNGAFEARKSTKGSPYFVIRATNKEIIGKSQMYASPSTCSRGIKSVMNHAPRASTHDLT